MSIESILLSILGKGAYDIIKGIGQNIFSDADEGLIGRLYNVVEKASNIFFKEYHNRYGKPSSSFLARQENIDIILKSIFYGNEGSLFEKINPKGFDGVDDVPKEVLNFFINTLESEMMQDFLLNKILIEKKHIKDSKEVGNQILETLNTFIRKQSQQTQLLLPNEKPKAVPKEDWKMTDDFGNELLFKQGERYVRRFSNGLEITFMIKDDSIFTELTTADGETSYYELDFDGNVKNSKFPYPLSEYTMDIPDGELINKKIIPIGNGFYKEVYILKWDRKAEVFFNKDAKIQKINLQGGWFVSHSEKKIKISEGINLL